MISVSISSSSDKFLSSQDIYRIIGINYYLFYT